ncbi:unnamed protein product [Linum trigynum]|uniref:GDSL esterase/lipase n=2 Tax=Linum trigynum TaxID=586398 RepID=A0AAV2EF88_9ROSI
MASSLSASSFRLYMDLRRLSSLFMTTMVVAVMTSCSEGQMVPAAFVFGDSVVDVGNNNHLLFSIAKSNYPHYGVDFAYSEPTGRFSNGKIPSDLVAEKLGLPSPPPYLSIRHIWQNINKNVSKLGFGFGSIPLTGLNFASAGCGVLKNTGSIFGVHISLEEQVDYYAKVYSTLLKLRGYDRTENIVSKALFLVVIGSNDMLNYYDSDSLREKFAPQDRSNQTASKLVELLERLYAYGARRFALTGLPALGCAPARRLHVKNQECDEELNSMCDAYNRMLKPMLQQFKSKHKGVSYTYFDAYTFFLDVINNASHYGFSETKAACCGVGELEAEFLCTPFSDYCEDRNKYMFFDRIHPTEAMYRHVVDAIIDGPSKYVAPMNIRKLVSGHAS